MNEELINAEICKSKILNNILIDYNNYDDNTNILILLNGVVKSIIQTHSTPEKLGQSKKGQSEGMAHRLLFDLKLIETFAGKINSDEYKQSIATRKCIYPFIHNLTAYILEFEFAQ